MTARGVLVRGLALLVFLTVRSRAHLEDALFPEYDENAPPPEKLYPWQAPAGAKPASAAASAAADKRFPARHSGFAGAVDNQMAEEAHDFFASAIRRHSHVSDDSIFGRLSASFKQFLGIREPTWYERLYHWALATHKHAAPQYFTPGPSRWGLFGGQQDSQGSHLHGIAGLVVRFFLGGYGLSLVLADVLLSISLWDRIKSLLFGTPLSARRPAVAPWASVLARFNIRLWDWSKGHSGPWYQRWVRSGLAVGLGLPISATAALLGLGALAVRIISNNKLPAILSFVLFAFLHTLQGIGGFIPGSLLADQRSIQLFLALFRTLGLSDVLYRGLAFTKSVRKQALQPRSYAEQASSSPWMMGLVNRASSFLDVTSQWLEGGLERLPFMASASAMPGALAGDEGVDGSSGSGSGRRSYEEDFPALHTRQRD